MAPRGDAVKAARLLLAFVALACGDAQRSQGPALREPAPEFAGIDTWLNSPPLSMADLRGKVVLVDFWTFACANCIRTLPERVRWHERYAGRGLVLVGVHAPELDFERDVARVREALARHAIRYPVAIDDGFATWRAYDNRYWPALYLVGRDGRVVFAHAGEGGYAEIERAIEAALEAG